MSQKEKRAPTSQDRAFHILKPGAAENVLKNAVKRQLITEEDSRLIFEFANELQASNVIGKSRFFKIVSVLVNWRRMLTAYNKNKIEDVYRGLRFLEEVTYRGHGYTKNTKRDYVMFLKRFYKWLIENKHSSISLEKIQKIKAPGVDLMTKTAGDLLDEMEVLAMINACQNNRDRALISVLYEGAFRIMELATLTWSQVKFDEYGAVINVDLKTERPRYIRLVASVPHLATWMKSYPYPPEGSALVFISAKHNPLQYEAVNVQLKKIARRANIKKRITPHIFRHSRITCLHRQGCNEGVLKMMAWGHQGTRMMAVYSHLTGTDIDGEILRMHGVEKSAVKSNQTMQVMHCKHCMTLNEPGSKFCGMCGMPLNEKEQRSMNQIVKEIERNPLYLTLMEEMKKKIVELQSDV
jgi:site-specific recombinase XerD